MSSLPSDTSPNRVEHQHTDKGYVPVYTTAVVEQPWDAYTPVDHDVWAQLFKRQRELLVGRASDAFLAAQDAMGMTPDAIPKFEELNAILQRATGWTLVGVEGLLPELTFFEHLANRRFPVTWWIRKPEQLDYLEEPDIFHDVFGHVPLLVHPVFADYMQAYGEGGLRAARLGMIDALARLYWYTVEFGLIRDGGDLKLYGAGIVSSYGESLFAIDDPSPNRIGFDLERVMRSLYRIDDYQQNYFVIDSFEDLLQQTRDADLEPIYDRLRDQEAIDVGRLLPTDRILHAGTQAYAHGKANA